MELKYRLQPKVQRSHRLRIRETKLQMKIPIQLN